MNFAYYCSGHGYGHATRVSALSAHLLQLTPKPSVTIISSAPPHVFSDSTKLGAKYRSAKVDPVIQQPLAYRVDRKKSVEVLEAFLNQRESLIEAEVRWLKANGINCVLSDAVFIACAAANRACLPSVLVTNFTFDSIWSYLSAALVEAPSSFSAPGPLATLNAPAAPTIELEPDEPIAHSVMDPLADRIARDYRNADLLLRLPGYLPFPSFSLANPLPATEWIDPVTRRFHPSVLADLLQPVDSIPLYDPIPFPHGGPRKPFKRQIKEAPLLVRHPAPDVYSQEARERILDAAGVPKELQGMDTKVVIVSFGGQVIKKPTHSRNGSRNLSISGTPSARPVSLPPIPKHDEISLAPPARDDVPSIVGSDQTPTPMYTAADLTPAPRPATPPELKLEKLTLSLKDLPRIATPSHIFVPGAPPASNPSSPIIMSRRPTFPTPSALYSSFPTPTEEDEEPEPRLLPDGWIAIVCGVAKNWGEEDLPEGFYIAPRDIWMPDLTAVADVLLGKLGYGTCAECVDACTPFVYVPRPLIVEEHGLRELMESSGVGVLLPQERYEMGDWAGKIEEAYEKGKYRKAAKRKEGWSDIRKREADAMAKDLVSWVDSWYEAIQADTSEGNYELHSSVDVSAPESPVEQRVVLGLGLNGVPIAV